MAIQTEVVGTMYTIANRVNEALSANWGDLGPHLISNVPDSTHVRTLPLVSTILLPDHWEGAWVYVDEATDAAPEGEERQVTAYDRANGELTLANAFSSIPVQATDYFQLYPAMHPQRIRDCILQALDAGTRGVVTTLADLTATPINTAQQTALPDLFVAEGALYFCRLSQARKLRGKERQDVLQLAHSNLENFRQMVEPIYGEINLGRRDSPEDAMPTERELMARF